MLEGVREMVLPADDVTDVQIGIIGARGQMVSRIAIGAEKREVFYIVR